MPMPESKYRRAAPWDQNLVPEVAKEPSLKDKIHAFRLPLSPKGKILAGAMYFAFPLIVGTAVVNWAQSKSAEKWKDGGPGTPYLLYLLRI